MTCLLIAQLIYKKKI